jgi:hypothetical protein
MKQTIETANEGYWDSFDEQWEKDNPIGVWQEVKEGTFDYYLGVLPPIHWRRSGMVESFKCSEPMDHRNGHPRGTYTCCAKYRGKFYSSLQGFTATAEEIGSEVIDFVSNQAGAQL